MSSKTGPFRMRSVDLSVDVRVDRTVLHLGRVIVTNGAVKADFRSGRFRGDGERTELCRDVTEDISKCTNLSECALSLHINQTPSMYVYQYIYFLELANTNTVAALRSC